LTADDEKVLRRADDVYSDEESYFRFNSYSRPEVEIGWCGGELSDSPTYDYRKIIDAGLLEKREGVPVLKYRITPMGRKTLAALDKAKEAKVDSNEFDTVDKWLLAKFERGDADWAEQEKLIKAGLIKPVDIADNGLTDAGRTMLEQNKPDEFDEALESIPDALRAAWREWDIEDGLPPDAEAAIKQFEVPDRESILQSQIAALKKQLQNVENERDIRGAILERLVGIRTELIDTNSNSWIDSIEKIRAKIREGEESRSQLEKAHRDIELLKADRMTLKESSDDIMNKIWAFVRPDDSHWDYPARVVRWVELTVKDR
jgi:hypothetical protein